MNAREVLTMEWEGRPSASASDVGCTFVLIDEIDSEAPIRPSQARPGRRRAVDAHAIGMMRDLVLGAFLGAQFFHDDNGSYVAPYTTENTRDSRPVGLTKDDLKTPGAVDMKRTTTRVQASETRPKKKGAIPLGPLAFQDAHIVREVGRLAPEYGQWLRYAYGDSREWDDEQGAVIALWARSEPLFGKVQAKTLKRVRSLTHLAVQSGKARMNSGKEVHQPARLRELLGVTEPNWDQHWAPRWKLYAEQLEQLDRDALAALLARLGNYEFILIDRGI